MRQSVSEGKDDFREAKHPNVFSKCAGFFHFSRNNSRERSKRSVDAHHAVGVRDIIANMPYKITEEMREDVDCRYVSHL